MVTITGKTSIGVSYCTLINKFCSRYVSTAIDDHPSASVLDVANKAHHGVHVHGLVNGTTGQDTGGLAKLGESAEDDDMVIVDHMQLVRSH